MAAHKRRPLHAQMRGGRPRSVHPTLPPRSRNPGSMFTAKYKVCVYVTHIWPTPAPAAAETMAAVRRPGFLDVDGVLCCNHETRLEAAPCAELQRIAESTRAAVVLSTDWRRDPSLSSRINDAISLAAYVRPAARRAARLHITST